MNIWDKELAAPKRKCCSSANTLGVRQETFHTASNGGSGVFGVSGTGNITNHYRDFELRLSNRRTPNLSGQRKQVYPMAERTLNSSRPKLSSVSRAWVTGYGY